MKKKYTKKQITEAIAYWEKILKNMNESTTYSQFENVRKFLTEQLGYDCSRLYIQEGFGDIIDDLYSLREFERWITDSNESRECIENTLEYRKIGKNEDPSSKLQSYFWQRDPEKLWILGKSSKVSSYKSGYTIGTSNEFNPGDRIHAVFFGLCEEAVPLLVWYASFDPSIRSAGLNTQWFFQNELDAALELASGMNFSHGDSPDIRQEQYEQITSALNLD